MQANISQTTEDLALVSIRDNGTLAQAFKLAEQGKAVLLLPHATVDGEHAQREGILQPKAAKDPLPSRQERPNEKVTVA